VGWGVGLAAVDVVAVRAPSPLPSGGLRAYTTSMLTATDLRALVTSAQRKERDALAQLLSVSTDPAARQLQKTRLDALDATLAEAASRTP
jgi:hypothetical protein